MVSEWLLYPVGCSLYFFSFLAYWVFRRLRRRYFEKEAEHYKPQLFEPNRTFQEFILNYKSKTTRMIEEQMMK